MSISAPRYSTNASGSMADITFKPYLARVFNQHWDVCFLDSEFEYEDTRAVSARRTVPFKRCIRNAGATFVHHLPERPV